MQFLIQSVALFVSQLATGRYPDHVKAWGKYLIPVRDNLLLIYPVSPVQTAHDLPLPTDAQTPQQH